MPPNEPSSAEQRTIDQHGLCHCGQAPWPHVHVGNTVVSESPGSPTIPKELVPSNPLFLRMSRAGVHFAAPDVIFLLESEVLPYIERLTRELGVAKALGEKWTPVLNERDDALAERDRLTKLTQDLLKDNVDFKVEATRLRAALEGLLGNWFVYSPESDAAIQKAREALAVGHSHTESNQNDGYSQRGDALKGISAQHASEGISEGAADETTRCPSGKSWCCGPNAAENERRCLYCSGGSTGAA